MAKQVIPALPMIQNFEGSEQEMEYFRSVIEQVEFQTTNWSFVPGFEKEKNNYLICPIKFLK